MNLQDIKNKLTAFSPSDIKKSDFAPAAVNIILVDSDLGISMIFTRRSNKVGTHKGQISFPGGRKDKSDKTLWETAIRETCEEIGLERKDFSLIARMDDYLTISSFNVRPFISYYKGIQPTSYRIQKDELEYVLEVPLQHLLSEKNFSMVYYHFRGVTVPVPHFWYHGNMIWGVTGFILLHFIKIIGGLESFTEMTDYRIENFGDKNAI